jgi:hypothetical protein
MEWCRIDRISEKIDNSERGDWGSEAKETERQTDTETRRQRETERDSEREREWQLTFPRK